MVPRLWVPLTHSLWARNWKPAAWGACLTASRVANKVAVSTPLRIESLTSAVVSVLVILPRLLGCGLSGDGWLGLGRLLDPGSGPPSRVGGCPVRRWRAGARLGPAGQPAPPPPCRWRRLVASGAR